MNVKDYEYIVEIAESGSLTKAAEHLMITAGALSKYLTRVERELNVPLFKRLGGKLLLTAAGVRYIETGRAILRLDEQLGHDIAALADNGDAAIHLGAPRGMNAFIVKRLLPEFFRRRPSDQIAYDLGGSKDLIQSLADGKLDICIAYAAERRQNLSYVKLARMEIALAVPVSSPLTAQARPTQDRPYPLLESDAWLDEPYISITTQTRSGQAAERCFELIGRRPPARIYVGDTNTALSAVESGLGYTLMRAVPDAHSGIRFLSLPGLGETGEYLFMITRRNDFHSEGSSELLSIIKKLFHIRGTR